MKHDITVGICGYSNHPCLRASPSELGNLLLTMLSITCMTSLQGQLVVMATYFLTSLSVSLSCVLVSFSSLITSWSGREREGSMSVRR